MLFTWCVRGNTTGDGYLHTFHFNVCFQHTEDSWLQWGSDCIEAVKYNYRSSEI